jgi:acetylornithine deacetylase/succinyl-diaminopimelate desuccinylase-like protein
MRIGSLVALFLAAFGFSVAAQQRAPELGPSLLQNPAVRAAVDAAKASEQETIEDQIRLCEVEAPPFQEARRAQLFAQLLRDTGLKNVRIDAEGNVIGVRPGQQARPNVVVSAHLDTVFPKGTVVKVRRDGPMLHGPGIGDDCRGLADVLAVARVLGTSAIATPGTITFVATVGEEGLGDLRGVKRLFNESLKDGIDRFVSIDGDGVGMTFIGIGSIRYRVTFKGPGGHSFGSFGTVNPVHALGRAIARIADLQVPSSPRTTFNVGRIGGGTAINAIPADAWMEVDLRSADATVLKMLEQRFRQTIDDAVTQENARWGSQQLTVAMEVVGVRPAGRASPNAPIVQAAMSVQRALNLPVSFAEGSTDSNYPLSLNVPAVTVDTGGTGSGVHTLDEAFNTTDAWKGTERALLLALALAQP